MQLTPNDAEKIIYVRNSLSGSRSILLFQGTYNASNDYEVPAGTTAVVFFNGAGTGAVAANVFNNAHFDALNVVGSVTVGGGVTVTGTVDAGTVEFDNLSGTGAVSVTNILDEDNMASNSATALSTQQSIKAYVDSQVGTVDTLAEILANGNTTGGNDIVFSAGDNITNASGNLTIDVAGELIIDADSSSIVRLKDAGTEIGLFYGTSSDFYIKSQVADKDLIFQGNDNGSTITALTLDMSAAGRAIFNADANMADGNAFRFGDNQDFLIYHSSNQNIIQANTTDQDIIFKGVDNGSSITALTLDMSEAGAATFNVGGVFNESGADSDFRVESDSNANMLFVDAGNNRVSVGQGVPSTSAAGSTKIGDFTVSTTTYPVAVFERDMAASTSGDFTGLAIVGKTTGTPASGLSIGQRFAINNSLIGEITSGYGGSMVFKTATIGNSYVEKLKLASTVAVFNESGGDIDFRVESSNNSNIFFVDAGFDSGQGAIGIGTSNPSRASGFGGSQTVVHVTGCSVPELRLTSSTSGQADLSIYAGNSGATAKLNNQNGGIELSRGGTNQLTVSNGVVINEDSNDYDFRVESDGNANMLFVDAGE